MDEDGVAVVVVAGGAGGVGPDEGGADGRGPVPIKGVGAGGGGTGEVVFDELGGAGAGLVGEDHISRGLGVNEAPAVGVVGAGDAEVVGGVDEQRLERTGAHEFVGEFAGVELDEQGG